MNDKSDNIFSNDKYTIFVDNELGSGAFSRVYKGIYDNKEVAIKIIKIRNLSEKVIKQLKLELKIIKIIMKNPHINLLQYYAVESHPNLILIIMEKCDGSELTTFINKGINEIYIKNIIKQLINVYLYLLNLSIIHRDIKPANILVNKNGTIKLIDFGLSKILNTDLTSTMCGSPLYMAPEILYKQDYDSTSDIWSMGILLYELIYGFTPFGKSKNISNLKYEIIKNTIPFPIYNNKNNRISENCINFMKSLLNIYADKRLNWENISNNKWLSCNYNNLKETTIINNYTNASVNKNSESDIISENLLFESMEDADKYFNDDIEKDEDDAEYNNSINRSNSDIFKTAIEKSHKIKNSTNSFIYNKSKLDYIDFVMVDKPALEEESSNSITDFVYSRSAPLTNEIISRIKGLHRSATKISGYLFSK